MGGSNEDSETQLESEAKDAEENIDDNGTPGNQIRVVAFMCSQGLLDLDGRNSQKYLHQT